MKDTENILLLGDCLSLLKQVPDSSIELVLCDLPYGTTQNKWDTEIRLDTFWEQVTRLLTPCGSVVLFGSGMFSAKLMLSNPKMHKYNLIWEKTSPTGYLNAKKQPLRAHEDLIVFYNKQPTYNPQKTQGHTRKVSTAHHKRNAKVMETYSEHLNFVDYDSTERYPRSVLKFPSDKQKSALHPTQKPLALVEYLIKTYSNEGDTVLDCVAGSGTTGLAAKNLNRKYILMEKDEVYYALAKERLANN